MIYFFGLCLLGSKQKLYLRTCWWINGCNILITMFQLHQLTSIDNKHILETEVWTVVYCWVFLSSTIWSLNSVFQRGSRVDYDHDMMTWIRSLSGIMVHCGTAVKAFDYGVSWYYFQFEGCDYSSLSKDLLARHSISAHRERLFICVHCVKTFKTLNNLKQHENVIHPSGEKLYKCDQCDFSSHVEQYLKRHMKIHSDVKQFKWASPYNLVWAPKTLACPPSSV